MSISATSSVLLTRSVQPFESTPLEGQSGGKFDAIIRSLADCYHRVDKVLEGTSVSAPDMIRAQKELSLLHFRLSLIAKSVDAASSLSRRLQHG